MAEALPFPRTIVDYVVGGHDTEKNDWPWMATLVESESTSHYWGQFCGGAVIGRTWILTAAHCTYDAWNTTKSPDSFDVVLGVHNLKTDRGERIGIKRILRHPAYIPGKNENDIALLELNEPTSIKPIVLFSGKTVENKPDQLVGVTAFVLGWGTMTPDTNNYPEVLQQVNLPIISNIDCQLAYATDTISENMLCAGFKNGGKDACRGDSGGPLVIHYNNEWVHAGVVSWGKGCAQDGFYGVYSRTSDYIDFIKENVSDAVVNPQAVVTVEPRILKFVDAEVDVEQTEIITIHNFGTSNLQIISIAQIDTLIEPFSIIIDNCTSQILSPDEQCQVTIKLSSFRGSFIEESLDVRHYGADREVTIINISSGNSFPWLLFMQAILPRE
ncbi:MAG: serine protease [Bacteroidetes bacterium]|nr:serine protease [Bacteroidota bacterium]